MKTLVICHPADAHTRAVAEQIAQAAGADLHTIAPPPSDRDGAPARPNPNPADYDLLFAGGGGRAAVRPDALLSFLARHPVRGKCVALFCCRRGGSARFFRALQDALPGNIILDEAAFAPPRFWQRSDAGRPGVGEWALRVASSAVRPSPA